MQILLNLIEVVVIPGSTGRFKLQIRIFFTGWLLMGIVLTNSYKGLLIAYLSVPWIPEQDYSYFEQIQNFQLYSSSMTDSKDSWMHWSSCSKMNWRDPSICNKVLQFSSSFGKFALHHTNFGRYTRLLQSFQPVLVYPKNNSKLMFQKLTSSTKQNKSRAIVGLNAELDDMLAEMQPQFKGIHLFRGKEKRWSQNTNWQFFKIGYSQPRAELIRLMTSGIYQFWKYWLRKRKNIEAAIKEQSTASLHPLNLSSSVTFVFAILIFGLTIAFIVCLGEILSYLLRKIHTSYNLRIGLRNSFMIIGFTALRLQFNRVRMWLLN